MSETERKEFLRGYVAALDTDNDGFISKDEFMHAHLHALSEEEREDLPSMDDQWREMLSQMDANADGRVSVDEMFDSLWQEMDIQDDEDWAEIKREVLAMIDRGGLTFGGTKVQSEPTQSEKPKTPYTRKSEWV